MLDEQAFFSLFTSGLVNNLVQALGLPLVAIFYSPKELQVHYGTLRENCIQSGLDYGVIAAMFLVFQMIDDFRILVVFVSAKQGVPLVYRKPVAQPRHSDIQPNRHVFDSQDFFLLASSRISFAALTIAFTILSYFPSDSTFLPCLKSSMISASIASALLLHI